MLETYFLFKIYCKTCCYSLTKCALNLQVLTFPTNCGECNAPANTNMKITNIPYFKAGYYSNCSTIVTNFCTLGSSDHVYIMRPLWGKIQ